MAWTTLCDLSALTEGKAIYVEAAGYQLAVYLHDGEPRAMVNYCPHAGGSMAGGYVEDGCAVCPWHNWPFRLDNGNLKGSTAVQIAVYPTRIMPQPGGAPPSVQADLPEVTDAVK
jgi:nitrite reductase (NADH) small subunit/3-phenylpropionate/trans-cinnamate dioxygenase ferredoxin subunit